MKFVSTWARQAARAAGASLIAPLAVLLVAGVVASGGSLGGITSLGQIASGPALPDIGLDSAPQSALEGAEIVGATVPEPGLSPQASVSGPLASTVPAGSAPDAPVGGLPPSGTGPRAPTGTIKPPAPPANEKEDDAPVPPAEPPEPVDDLLEFTRGIGDSIPGPLGPITNDILNLLLGPPRP